MRPDLESIMLRKSIGSMESHRPVCSRCERTPLVGEYMHRLGSDALLCGLCFAGVPESDRNQALAERVPAGERSLPVAKRAA